MEKKISGVYKIENTVTGDFYIGSSKNVMQRWASHKYPSYHKQHPNSPLYNDMQKYGIDKFRFQILATVEPKYLKQTEQEFIDLLHPSYNNHRAKGWDVERQIKNYKKAQKKYDNQLCSYNGETLTLCALAKRFRKDGIERPCSEAKKYVIKN